MNTGDTTPGGKAEPPAVTGSKPWRPSSALRSFVVRLRRRVRCEDFDVLADQLVAVDPRTAVTMLNDGSAELAYSGDVQRLRDALFRLRQAAEAAA